MMSELRKYASSWVSQLLLGILVLSFAVWGVADIFTGFGSNSVARVGSTEIQIVDFQRDYDLAVQNLSRQYGTSISQEQARQMGIPGQVLGRLVNQATLDNAATHMGLGLSGEQLGHKIARDPQFFGAGGVFDRGLLAEIIRSQGMTEDQFIVRRREEYERAQLAQAIAGGVQPPQTLMRAIHEYRNEERDVGYVVIAAPAESAIANPDDTALNAFFAERKADWQAPELRTVSYFVLSADTLAVAADVTDEDAKARYDDAPERFTTIEKRKIEQIVFPDLATAEAAASAISSGKTFDDIMAERKLTAGDVDLGLISKDGLVDPAISDAAFALAVNAVSPVIDGRFGPVLLRVTTIEPGTVTPFEEAKAQLKTEIAQERAVTEINGIRDSIEDSRAGGETLAEIATKFSLALVAGTAVDTSGNDDAGKPVANLPQGLVAAAFASDVGLENDPIQPDRNSYVWYEVTADTAPRERTLDEVRDQVVAAWKTAERQKQMQAEADAVAARLKNNDGFASVAIELGLPRQNALKLTRLGTPPANLSAEAVTDIFDGGPVGTAGVAAGAEPLTTVVFQVDNVTIPTFTADAQTEQQFGAQYINNLLGLYVNDLQSKTNVTFNQAALQQLFGAAATN